MSRRLGPLLAGALVLLSSLPAAADVSTMVYDFSPTSFDDLFEASFVAVDSARGFLVGGGAINVNDQLVATTQVRAYNPATGGITFWGDLPLAVVRPAVAFDHGIVHVFNGTKLQRFNPGNQSSSEFFVVGTLARELTGPSAAVPLGSNHFLLVGKGTVVGGSTQLRVVNDHAPSSDLVNGTLPFAVQGVDPVLRLPDGRIILFHANSVYQLDPSNAAQPFTQLGGGPTTGATIANGTAVWNGDHALVFDDQGRVLVWKPEWPASAGLRVFAHELAPPVDPQLVRFGSAVHVIDGAGGIHRWDVPALDVDAVTDCGGTTRCALAIESFSPIAPEGLDVTWTIEGVGVFTGPARKVEFPAAGFYEIDVAIADVLGRNATRLAYAYVSLLPPEPLVEYACDAAFVCRFDASNSTDDGLEALSFRWLVDGLGAALTGPVVTADFGGAAPRDVALVVRDGLGFAGYWNATVDPTGTPTLQSLDVTCFGLRCYLEIAVDDDEPPLSPLLTPTLAARWRTNETALPADVCDPAFLVYGFGASEAVFSGFGSCSFPTNGTYELVLTVTDGDGRSASLAQVVRVSNLAPVGYPFVDCERLTGRCTANASLQFYDPEGGELSFRWEPAPGEAVDGPFLDRVFADGLHSATIRVKDAAGAVTAQDVLIDARRQRWETRTALPSPSSDMAFASDLVYLYAVDVPATGTPRLLRLAHGESAWSVVPGEVPAAAPLGAAAVVEGELFVAGGGSGTSASAALRVFDLVEETWRTGPDLPAGRRGAGAVEFDGELLVLGGFGEGTAPQDSVLAYDPVAGSWRQFGTLPWKGVARAVEHGGRLYVVGGQTGADTQTQFAVYDEVQGAFVKLASPPGVFTPTPGLSVIDGALVYVGLGTTGSPIFARYNSDGTNANWALLSTNVGASAGNPPGRISSLVATHDSLYALGIPSGTGNVPFYRYGPPIAPAMGLELSAPTAAPSGRPLAAVIRLVPTSFTPAAGLLEDGLSISVTPLAATTGTGVPEPVFERLVIVKAANLAGTRTVIPLDLPPGQYLVSASSNLRYDVVETVVEVLSWWG